MNGPAGPHCDVLRILINKRPVYSVVMAFPLDPILNGWMLTAIGSDIWNGPF